MDLLSRRKFLNYTFLSSAVFVMSGCELFAIVTPLQTLEVLWDDLFPHAKKLGVKTLPYLVIVLNHSRITQENKEFLKNGVQWINEESATLYHTTYTKLSSSQREELLKRISQKEWGKKWLSSLMSYGFEAMFSDPVYKSNMDEVGWKWLAFEGGKPRPKRAFL